MSFNTALSGLNAASSELGVVSNNVANSSTVGFKGSRAEFADVYATSALGAGSTAIGSGVLLSEVAQQFKQGNLEFTESTLDLAISGDGFFVVHPDQNTQNSEYSRAGAFQVNASGFVVNSSGAYLQALPVNEDGTVTSTSLSSTINLELPQTAGSPAASTEIEIGANFQADAPGKATEQFSPTDAGTYNSSTSLTVYDSLGSSHITTMYFVKIEGVQEALEYADNGATNDLSTAQATAAANALDTESLAGGTDASAAAAAINAAADWSSPLYDAMYLGQNATVTDLSDAAALAAATDIETEMNGAAVIADAEADAIAAALPEVLDPADATIMVAAWVASDVIITADATKDGTAAAEAMVTTYNNAGNNRWATFVYSDDGNGNSVGRDIVAASPNQTVNALTPDYGIVEFTSGGLFLNSTPDPMITESVSYPNGADSQELTLDFANNSPTQYSTPFNVTKLSQDGYTAGRLTGIDIAESGVVRANYSNGTQAALGKIALANFANPQGLKQLGSTAWAESLDSGTPLAGEAGTGSFGNIKSGALESSNVDLTAQLVKLITAQRNFQANAKSIETASAITNTVIQMR